MSLHPSDRPRSVHERRRSPHCPGRRGVDRRVWRVCGVCGVGPGAMAHTRLERNVRSSLKFLHAMNSPDKSPNSHEKEHRLPPPNIKHPAARRLGFDTI